ncbi:MAG: hypothetical protein KAS96_05350 [Planctomycetes bacterium]|nr:hypothetical protein [Planctomycetota bacterium]
MINSVNNDKIQNLLTQQTANQTKKSVAKPETGKNAELQANFASLIEKAIQADSQQNPDAVQNAKKLLLSGELDNIENIRKAAQNIIDFGI